MSASRHHYANDDNEGLRKVRMTREKERMREGGIQI